jgi:hypothetical protein
MKKFVFALAFALLGLVVATNAQNPNVVAKPEGGTAIIITASPEFTGVPYARGTNGSLAPLPRANIKIGKLGGMGITLPSEIPTVNGPIVIKFDGSGDPRSLIEIGGGKGFKKEVKFEVKNLGDRTFEVVPGPADGDCVVALKGTNPLSMPEMFAFRVEGKK